MSIQRPVVALVLYMSIASLIVLSFACQRTVTYEPIPDEKVEENAAYVLKLPAGLPPMPVPADNPLTEAGVELGRYLFYDKLLGADGENSCATCHIQAFAFTDGKAVSNSLRPNARNSMPLFNLAWKDLYFWDGRTNNLEVAALDALNNELEPDTEALMARLRAHADYPRRFARAFADEEAITKENTGRALAQFLRILVSFDAPRDQNERGKGSPSELEIAGEGVMAAKLPRDAPGGQKELCVECHKHKMSNGSASIGLFLSPKARNNGLGPAAEGVAEDPGAFAATKREQDRGLFVAPSLRNLNSTGPYMHDGRFATLEEVLDHYSQHIEDSQTLDPVLQYEDRPLKLNLSQGDKDAVIAMLRGFSDEAFLSNPAYANPYE